MSVVDESPVTVAEIRRRIVANALWGVDNAAQIAYSHLRPIDGNDHPYQLPLSTDCSGFVTLCYRWAEAADPNGRGFDGFGYTGTILTHCPEIARETAQRGDLVVFGEGTGEHVVVLIDEGPNPEVVSHGSDKGPLRTTLQAEIDYHGRTVRFVRCPDLTSGGGGVHAQAVRPADDELRTMANPATED